MQNAPTFPRRHDPCDHTEIDLTPSPYQRRLLGPALRNQSRIVDALVGSADLGLFRLGIRIADCCRHAQAAVTPEGFIRCIEFRCKSRLCPICEKRRSAAMFHRLNVAVKTMNAPRAIHLTLAHTDTPLRDQLLRLRKCFAELRRTTLWKGKVTSGAYVVEVTFNTKEQRWHPHLHIIADGHYMQMQQLKDAWLQVTKDSHRVRIEKIYDAKKSCSYFAKYISKSNNPADLPDERLLEWAIEIRGLRFIQCFGKLHGVKLDKREKSRTNTANLSPLGSIGAIAAAAERGDKEAGYLIGFIQSCRHRRIPDAEPGQSEKAPPGEQAIVERVRAWFSNQEKAHRDQASNYDNPSRLRCTRDRPIGLWQDADAPPDSQLVAEAFNARHSGCSD